MKVTRKELVSVLSSNFDVLIASAVILLTVFLLSGRFLLNEGTPLFGDFVPTTDVAHYLRANYPLWSNRNSFNYVGSMRLPYLLVFCLPFHVLGVPAEVFFKFMILSVLGISGVSMYVAARHFLSRHCRDKKTLLVCCLASSILYAFNPWVMDRIYHTYLLMTYSLIPLVFIVAAKTFAENGFDMKRVLSLVLLCTLGSTSPHGVFFMLLAVGSLYFWFLLLDPREYLWKTKNLVLFSALYVLLNAFWILPLAGYSSLADSPYPDYVTYIDHISLFSRNSSLLNVLRLMAYWWPKVSYSPDAYPLNTLWAFASLAVPTLSFLALMFCKRDRTILYLSALSVFLIFMATGTNLPLPGFYEWLCFDAPFLSSFGWLLRDPNKWALLLPLTLSMLLSFTCLGFVEALRKTKRALLGKAATLSFLLLTSCLVVAYVSPPATNYFAGPFRPVTIPLEIREVNEWLANHSESFQVLWMPSYSEHGAMWVYSGLCGAFELDSSAKPTFDVNSKYVRSYMKYYEKSLLENRISRSADYLKPLNVRFVVLHNDSLDSGYADLLLQSLQNQEDLELAMQTGMTYVFENKAWLSSPFLSFAENGIITGGFNRLGSLNALETPSVQESSLAFADQDISGDCSSDFFVLGGDLLSDALPFFLQESTLIAPFDFSHRHKPDEEWSKASLSDLSGGPFHPYLEQFGVECWDFDYDKGVAFTWASFASLKASFWWPSRDDFTVFARIFENTAGGNLTLSIGESSSVTVNTKSRQNRFAWINVGTFKGSEGEHALALKNDDGLNAVNLIALMPGHAASDLSFLFEKRLRHKDLLYVLEAESDMFWESATVGVSCRQEASNGMAIELPAGTSAFGSIELACGGSYTALARGQGELLLAIDGNSGTGTNLQPGSGYVMWDSLSLNAGIHELEVSASRENESAELDVLWLLKTESLLKLGEQEPTENQSRVLSIRQIDSTKYVIELAAGPEIMLCSSQAYNPAWAASVGGQQVRSRRVFGVVNGFRIAAGNGSVVVVELQPQALFYVGAATSLSVMLFCGTHLFFVCRRKRLRSIAVSHGIDEDSSARDSC